MKQRLQHTLLVLLIFVLAGCNFPGLQKTDAQLPVVEKKDPPLNLPPVKLPEDHGAHNNLTEWWYFTGHVQQEQREYGFEFVIFRVMRSDLPPYYAAHFAITDLTRNEFHYDQRLIMAKPEPPQQGLNEQAGSDWRIEDRDGQIHLLASMKDYHIDLALRNTKPAALHHGDGLVRYGLLGYSYYYSQTSMQVTGTLRDHEQELTVTGKAWFDHQWGDFLTSNGGGWDWYSLQLDNNTELMIYFIRDNEGTTVSTYASVITADGHSVEISDRDLHLTALGSWKSPASGFSYPSSWNLKITDSRFPLNLSIQPRLQNQELIALPSTANIYWEGAVRLAGDFQGQAVSGRGYVELTGYK